MSEVTRHPAVVQDENNRLHTELQLREEEIVELKKEIRRLRSLAYFDKTSGVRTKVFLEEAFEVLEDKTEPFCLVMLDLDHFKKINDDYGHIKGDEILNRFGSILKTVSHRENDVSARWGGEEFVVLLRNCDMAGAKVYAARLERRIKEDLVIHLDNGSLLRATASIGVAECRLKESMISLLARADRTMYEAKSAGRNCVRFAA